MEKQSWVVSNLLNEQTVAFQEHFLIPAEHVMIFLDDGVVAAEDGLPIRLEIARQLYLALENGVFGGVLGKGVFRRPSGDQLGALTRRSIAVD